MWRKIGRNYKKILVLLIILGVLLSIIILQIINSPEFKKKTQLKILSEQLKNTNHGDTFSPHGSDYYKAEESADEIVKLGKEGIPIFLDALKKHIHIPIIAQHIWQIRDNRIIPSLLEAIELYKGTTSELWIRYALCKLNYEYEKNYAVFEGIMSNSDKEMSGSQNLMNPFQEGYTYKGRTAIILGKLGDDRSVEILIKTVLNEPRLKWDIVVALQYSCNPKATPILIKLLKEWHVSREDIDNIENIPNEPGMIRDAIIGVGACGGDEALPFLAELSEYKNNMILSSTAESLTYINDNKSCNLLM